MRRRVRAIAAGLMAGLLLACSREQEAAAPAFDAAGGLARVQAVRAELVEVWDRLDTLRAEMAALDARPRLTAVDSARKAELGEKQPQAEARFEVLYGSDQATLAEFLNAALGSRPAAPETLAALHLYAESAIRYAHDVVAASGDYRRAIDLLETASGYFADAHLPVPQRLGEALRHAKEYRVITRARFDRLAAGMTASQVRSLVGVPFVGNVRRSEVGGKSVTTWLYGSEENGVTALYFDDRALLYAWKWNVMSGE